ncbi:MAG TPA: GrpB family protein [Candidatus Baltobacteraceae bacterium]|jgi:GrpB-like predicted nucleotidyltransferase (UPF0157 family)|nr:GrpB family protein [Candidatus Baltobacteraceae bacterium]
MKPRVEIFGGRTSGQVTLVEYDAAWPARFERERAMIANALGDVARSIDHIGSTAVPGLAAKRVIDVCVGVDDVEREESFRPALEAAGYVLRVREPGHRMFRTPSADVHVHLWPAAGEDIARHLAFRDRLRENAADRALYDRTKRELAKRNWAVRNDYAEAKGEVIAQITQRARNVRSPNC